MARKKGSYIVRYNNEINTVALGALNVREAKLMAAVCAYVKNKGTRKVSMDFDLIRRISGFTDRDNSRLYDSLNVMTDTLGSLRYYEETGERGSRIGKRFTLFSGFTLDEKGQAVLFNVTEEFEFMLNKLGAKFTRFEADEYQQINGKYAIHLYRLLKQFRRSGKYFVMLEDFTELMNVSKSRANKISLLDHDVINPAIEELSQYFENLQVKKGYRKSRRGKPAVSRLTFTFTPEGNSDQGEAESTLDELRKNIADTELKILSTKKAMEKQDALGDYKKYEIHKKKHIYFTEKLETLKDNLAALDGAMNMKDGIQFMFNYDILKTVD